MDKDLLKLHSEVGIQVVRPSANFTGFDNISTCQHLEIDERDVLAVGLEFLRPTDENQTHCGESVRLFDN